MRDYTRLSEGRPHRGQTLFFYLTKTVAKKKRKNIYVCVHVRGRGPPGPAVVNPATVSARKNTGYRRTIKNRTPSAARSCRQTYFYTREAHENALQSISTTAHAVHHGILTSSGRIYASDRQRATQDRREAENRQ